MKLDNNTEIRDDNKLYHNGVPICTLPEHILDALHDDKKLVIRWDIEDVHDATDSVLSDTQALKVLRLMKHNHDCNHGITWEDIQDYANELLREDSE